MIVFTMTIYWFDVTISCQHYFIFSPTIYKLLLNIQYAIRTVLLRAKRSDDQKFPRGAHEKRLVHVYMRIVDSA